RTAFLLTRTAPDPSSRQINIYHRPPLTVAMEQKEGQWVLQFLSDTDAIIHQVRELWNLGPQQAARASPFSLPESGMEEVRQARPLGETEIQKRLEKAGVPSASAEALARTLANPRQNGALVAMGLRQGVWDTGGLGMLEGENGLWLLRSFSRQQAPWIECVPRSGPQLLADVEALVKRFLPPPEG
ncbi:MAG: ESX secretion-associated protein EspG, partial [Anaerolineae bacterium]